MDRSTGSFVCLISNPNGTLNVELKFPFPRCRVHNPALVKNKFVNRNCESRKFDCEKKKRRLQEFIREQRRKGCLLRRRYCAIVNPIRRHVAGLSAKPLTILTACLIWVLAIVLAMPAAFFSYVPTVPLQSNHSILICSPFPEEFGEYFTYPLS